MSNRIAVEEGRGNVFADIGLPNPEERLVKADLAIRIAEAIRARQLTQNRAAHILQIDPPKIWRLLRGQLSGFSTERLMRSLTMLGRDVEIIVKRPPRTHSHLSYGLTSPPPRLIFAPDDCAAARPNPRSNADLELAGAVTDLPCIGAAIT